MLLSTRIVRLVLDAAEAVGVSREALVRPVGVTSGVLSERPSVEWGSFAAIMNELFRLVGRDVERVRDVGRRMARAAAVDDPLRQAAQGIASARELYDFADRWVLSTSVPHLRVFLRFFGDQRMLMHVGIPEPYAPCEAFLHMVEGGIVVLPEMIGLPAATVVDRRITDRTSDHVFDLPMASTFRNGARLAARTMIGRRASRAALERQGEHLAESLEALKRAREELRSLLDSLPDLVVVFASGSIVWANEALVAALGYEDVSTLVGMPLLDTVAPRSRAVARARSRAPNGGTWPPLTEIVLRGRRGDDVVVEVAPAQNVVWGGRPSRLVVGRDVTERVRMQQQLLVADRLASVGLLAAGVAHEVNNPLAYVLNNVEMARKALSMTDAGIDAELTAALEGVDRIRAIVKNLLLLSRGDRAPEEAVDVRAVAESTLAMAAQEIDRVARLEKDFRDCPVVRASGPRIAQILLNLIGGALDAMRGRVRDENELLVRIARAEDGRLLLEVSDSGDRPGDAELDRAFEPFHGKTLGLVVAQQLVNEIGGEISVSPALARGSTCRVLLPIAGT